MSEHPEYPELMTRDLPAGLTLIDGGVTAARGFRAGNTACGIKSDAGLPDLAMLVADAPCAAAGTFTTSKTASHTVLQPSAISARHQSIGRTRRSVTVHSSSSRRARNTAIFASS